MQYILVLIISVSSVPQGPMSMTAVSGYLTYSACKTTGEAWEKTKHDYERYYECLPAEQK